MINRKQFLGAFLLDRRVAAIQPSSPFLIRRLLRHIDASKLKTVIELGPGDGVATMPLLKSLPADARYLAIERNPAFAASLRGLDRRLEAVEGDVRDLRKIVAGKGLGQVDLILASVPFTYLSRDERDTVVATTKELLRPGGKLIVFHQYSPLMLPVLRRHFSSVKMELEPWNLPPCFLFSAQNPTI